MDKSAKVYVAGHRGLVGSAIVRKLQSEGYQNLITRTSGELDLTDSAATAQFFDSEKPEYVFLAAAKVGGILANSLQGADFICENILIQSNVITNSHRTDVKKLLFLGSSCIYPRMAPQPIREDCLLDGKLEETNKPYAVAKIAGITMCQAYNQQYGTRYISVMPTNLYGPNDNFDLNSSHVLPALIRKMHDARIMYKPEVSVWGTGTPKREFLHVDDLAAACLFLMQNYEDSEIINIGTGDDISIKDLAEMVKEVIGYQGRLVFDASKPDGTPRKLLDVSKINSIGWKATIDLQTGIEQTYKWFLQTHYRK
ncbi:MAG TPA: GDP-L-fucose synthase [Armatimonadota bacterium]|nr:GDP-L-fucose synthase [Armatimonadota bacterium]HOM71499.1 GDP-L-fucose synthase [Armatimonadota bacterium]